MKEWTTWKKKEKSSIGQRQELYIKKSESEKWKTKKWTELEKAAYTQQLNLVVTLLQSWIQFCSHWLQEWQLERLACVYFKYCCYSKNCSVFVFVSILHTYKNIHTVSHIYQHLLELMFTYTVHTSVCSSCLQRKASKKDTWGELCAVALAYRSHSPLSCH